ncbi:type I-G CRISPR-associated protein Cas8g1/Csx17 [Verrucomicrobium spinosum]|uniref:type I-G CRISPR-associated protein Cas8g1/Csx17 n=1 Tax=Verrucomicrobium spinosum TaxID=2736 RepID=UPI0001746121|nr:type I-U CRISPR-associated protein Csx17 [Verrucomicrobium spinosum]
MPVLTLTGCAPVPLAHYLKALGVFRLVSDSADGDAFATASWKNDSLQITSRFDREDLLRFFLNNYQPTPIVAPWNGGSGFYEGDEQSAVESIQNSTSPRFGELKRDIATILQWSQLGPTKQAFSIMVARLKEVEAKLDGKAAKDIGDLVSDFYHSLADFISEVGITEDLVLAWHIEQAEGFDVGSNQTTKKAKSNLIKAAKKVRTKFKQLHRASGKEEIILLARSSLSDVALSGIDAMVPLLNEGQVAYPPLFGSGGTDGRLEFTNKYLQCLCEVIDPKTGLPTVDAATWLETSLFQETTSGPLSEAPIGQFFPGAAGGANSKSGFGGGSTVNPWDFIFMMDGGMMFAGSAAKRFESDGDAFLVCPFCVGHNGIGFGSSSRSDEAKAGCEIWAPLWERPATFGELKAVFSEGRAQLRGGRVQNGVDFAQAAVTLGVDRGISEFQRYAILERNGQSNFATPLGRFAARRNARVDLLADVQKWMSRLRIKTDSQSKPKAPNGVRSAFNVVERRIMELCQKDSPDHLQSLLAALGSTERAVARSFNWASEKDKFQRENISPLRGLRQDWLEKIGDSAETRLAASLAGARVSFGKGRETLWFRQHLEPLKRSEKRGWFNPMWSELSSENDVTWHEGDLADSLNAILTRRIQRVENAGAEGWPDWSPRYASLADITAFIEQRTDDLLLADLIWGLCLLDWQSIAQRERMARLAAETVEQPANTSLELEEEPPRQEIDQVPDFDWRSDEEVRHQVVPSSFYALLKLCFRRKDRDGKVVPIVSAIHQRARMGDGLAASRLAARRLLASGEVPLVRELSVSTKIARRTAAALLFPISPRDIKLLKFTIQHQTEELTA